VGTRHLYSCFFHVIQFELSGSQVVIGRQGVIPFLTKGNGTSSDKANRSASGSGNQANVADIIAEPAGDGDVAHRFLRQCLVQALIFVLLKCLHQNLPICWSGIPLDDQRDIELRSGLNDRTLCGGFDRFSLRLFHGTRWTNGHAED